MLVVATFHVKVSQKIQQEFQLLDIGEGERRKKVQLHTRIDRKSDYAVETGKTLLSENIVLSTGNPQNISPTIAPLPPPATADIVTAFKSRFEK